MANWKKIVSVQNAKLYKWPEGWDTREKVAEHLECSPERVAEILAPAIKTGEVEKGQFPVWDAINGRKMYLVGYRPRQKVAPSVATHAPSSPKRGRPALQRKEPYEGASVRSKDSGTVGILTRENGRWKVEWPHCRPTYPSQATLHKHLEVL